VRVTDEHGASTSRQIGVNILGTGDEPVFGPLVLFGTDFHDVLLGSPQDDVIRGRGGPDTLVGFGGRDEFQFTDFNVPAFPGPDTIVDFQPGPGGDVLNLADVIDFAAGGTASNFVRFLDVNGTSQLQINQDGIGSDFISVATLQGVSGLLLNDLLANGNLVLA